MMPTLQASAAPTIKLLPERLRTVDPAYVSVAIDTSLLLGGVWWSSRGESSKTKPIDLHHPRLLALSDLLVRQAPTYLRIGGTDADRVWYSPHGEHHDPSALVLTSERWQAIHEWVSDLKMPLIYTLNAGPLTRESSFFWGPWQADNAALLLSASQHLQTPVKTWELGNEINGYPLFFGAYLSAEQYARDLLSFRQRFPQAPLAGPATAWWPVWGEPLSLSAEVLAKGGTALNYLTWHYYPQQSARCGFSTRAAAVNTLLKPVNLDTAIDYAEKIERRRRRYAPQAEHWLGETGHAQCGGAPGLSDAWVSSLWWLDQLGALAKVGVQVQVRQALVGSDYGLLAETDYAPRPDFWSTVLWKQLMGPEVLQTQSSLPQTVRHYAHCHPQQGVTFLWLNLADKATSFFFAYPLAKARRYTLTADQLTSKAITVNGTPIQESEVVSAGGFLGEPVSLTHTDGQLTLPSHSATFMHLPALYHQGCPLPRKEPLS